MELIHVLNRGVDKRKIFLDEQNYFRFIHDLFEFNDTEPAENLGHFFKNHHIVVRRRYGGEIKKEKRRERKLLVEIHAFCLMPNHYHLLLTPKMENGTALFMKKLNAGYSRYFNEKHKRRGALFEGKYKRIIIKDEAHFIHLPYYIHYNPLDLIMPEWRERKLRDHKKAMEFLENYRWSSHLDYLGKNNFPSVTHRKLLFDFFGGNKGYKNNMEGWLKESGVGEIGEFILEK